MSDNLARTSLNFEFFKRINTDLTPFEVIMYFFKDSHNLLIENPNKGTCYLTWRDEIKNYFKFGEIETPWEQLFDGSWLRIKNMKMHQIVPITTELEFINFSFVIKMFNVDLEMIRNIKEKNFKIKKVYAESRDSTGELKIKAYLPIWPMWAKINRSLEKTYISNDRYYNVTSVFMKIGDQFYRFPYGNVNTSDGVCLGGSNRNAFKNANDLWINFISTPFNTDYKFNVRANRLEPKRTHRNEVTSGQRREGAAPVTINVPSFNLEEISVRLASKNYDRISFVDQLYYLSHITDFDEFIPIDTYFKLPKLPWEEKK